MIGHGQRSTDEHEAGEDHKSRDDDHHLLDPLLLQVFSLSVGQRHRSVLPRGPEMARPTGSRKRLGVDEDGGGSDDAGRRGADKGEADVDHVTSGAHL